MLGIKGREFIRFSALAIREKALGPDHPDVAKSLNNLAEVYREQGRNADAEALYQRALAIREKALGPDHPDVAKSLNNLAEVYREQGRNADAEPVNRRGVPAPIGASIVLIVPALEGSKFAA